MEIFILTWKIQPIYLFILSFAKLYTIKIFLHNKYCTITIKKRLIPSNNIHSARRWNIRIQQNHHRSPRLNLNPSWTEGRSKGKTFAIDCIYIYHRQIGGGRGGIGLQRPHKFITNINFHDTNLPRIDNGPGYASPSSLPASPTFAKQIGFIPLVAIGRYIHHPLYREGIYRGASSILSRQDKSPEAGIWVGRLRPFVRSRYQT